MKYAYALLLVIFFPFVHLCDAAPPVVTVQVQVPAMKCAGCSWSVSEELKGLEGVSAVYVDPKTKLAVIEVPSKESPGKEAIVSAVKSAGYEATKYKELDETFAAAKERISGSKSS